MAKIAIIGAGVIGLTTAYYLNKQGHTVEVYEKNSGPGEGTSFANAGQISVGYSAPWAAPGIPLKALKWMFNANAPLAFRPQFDLHQYKWLKQFLQNCNEKSYEHNKRVMVQLSAFSKSCFKQLRAETDIQYEDRQFGTLQIFRDYNQLEQANVDAKILSDLGINSLICGDRQSAERLEPGLKKSDANITGALWIPGDETGDCNMFCKNLEQICKNNGVVFMYNHPTRLWLEGNKLRGIVSKDEKYNWPSEWHVPYDNVVVCSGTFSRELLKDTGIKIPVYPVRGHSMTFKINPDTDVLPFSTILDETNKVAITRFDDRIRAGGFAELGMKEDTEPFTEMFIPYSYINCDVVKVMNPDTNRCKKRAIQLESLVNELFPNTTVPNQHNEFDVEGSWIGYRPMTPNGIPIIGETKIHGLFLNTGHGTLGWTMSCGSGRLLADIFSGNKIDYLNVNEYKPK